MSLCDAFDLYQLTWCSFSVDSSIMDINMLSIFSKFSDVILVHFIIAISLVTGLLLFHLTIRKRDLSRFYWVQYLIMHKPISYS